METFKAMIRDFDESWTADTLKKAKRITNSEGSHPCKTDHVDVAEVHSPPRITKMVRQLGMNGEIALDLTTTDENVEPWDLSKSKMREKQSASWTKPSLRL